MVEPFKFHQLYYMFVRIKIDGLKPTYFEIVA